MNKPVRTDFSVPTEGYESPWGTAQLTFIADSAKTPTPTRFAADFLTFSNANPGRISYPKPRDFHWTTFVKQLLLELAPGKALIQQPVTPTAFATTTQPLWACLDQLRPSLWRNGKTFPGNATDIHRMLGDGELKMSITFNRS